MADKKTAIVTGASQGIGAGLVEAFLIEGYNVVATSRHVTQSLTASPRWMPSACGGALRWLYIRVQTLPRDRLREPARSAVFPSAEPISQDHWTPWWPTWRGHSRQAEGYALAEKRAQRRR